MFEKYSVRLGYGRELLDKSSERFGSGRESLEKNVCVCVCVCVVVKRPVDSRPRDRVLTRLVAAGAAPGISEVLKQR